MIRDQVSHETSKVDWAQLLLDDQTDDMIITVSREKIAHEMIRLRNENAKLRQQAGMTPSQTTSATDYQGNLSQSGERRKGTGAPFGAQRKTHDQQKSIYYSGS